MSRSTALIVLFVVALPTAALAQKGRPTPTPPGPPATVCIDFEPPLAFGTRYGRPVGQSPGDLAFIS